MILEITYNWTIDIAIIFAAISIVITLLKWLINIHGKKKKSRIKVYEKVFDNVIYILLYPLNYQKETAKQKKYETSDVEFQESVRIFLNNNIYSTTYSKLDSIVPKRIISESEKIKYLARVQKEARRFEENIMNEQLDIDLLKLSPINYFDNSDIKNKFETVVQKVGKQLSYFSEDVQKHWQQIMTSDYKEVIKKYKDSLEICPNFFQHNPRGFSDPYIDILESIRNDYRKMTRKNVDTIFSKIKYYGFRIRHPIQSYEIYKKVKSLLN